MNGQLLVLVGGPPCSGKTTLASELSSQLSLPVIHKDDVKERLFDNLGWKDAQRSRALGGATMAILWYTAELFAAAGQSTILESTFDPRFDIPRVEGLLDRHLLSVVQLHCTATEPVLMRRFTARLHDSGRHPGHREDLLGVEEFGRRLRANAWPPLTLPGSYQEIDTSDTEAAAVGDTVRAVVQALFKRE